MQTVYLVCGVASLVPSLGLFLVHATNRTSPGFRQWALASTAAFTSMALLAMRGIFPDQPVVILINLTFFAYPLLLARGFRHFAGRPPQNWIAWLVLPAVATLAIFFTYVRPDPDARVFILSSLLVILFADCALVVRRVKHFAHPALTTGLITTFVLLVAWNLLRVPLTMGIGRWIGGPEASVVVLAGTMIILTATNIWICLCVILLNFAKASQSLRDSEERFRLAMHHSPIGMALVGIDGRWLEVNQSLCEIVGRTREELLGASFQSITHPDDRAADQALIGSLVAGEVPSYRREKRYLDKSGREIWVQVDVSMVFGPDGTPRHMVSQVVDVTERNRNERALRDYQGKLVMAMDLARLGHWEFDLATRRFTFDENFFKMLGTTAAREGGFEMSMEEYSRKFVPPEDADMVAEEMKKALTTADPQYTRQFERRVRRSDGSIGTMSVRFAIEKDAAGRTVRAFGLNQDITEQAQAAQQHKRVEEQLRQAQKLEALGALAGGIAHDFNNILTGIMGHMQLAEMDLPREHPVQANLREAGRAARRARDLVARILTFSRRYPSARELTALGPIVQEAVQLLRASLPSTIEIRTVIAADCPPVLCDASQIHQLVMNLGTNSAHAMRDDTGLLEVELKVTSPDRMMLERFPQVRADHRVRLTIRDTGCGMDAAVLAHVFEPFFTTKAPGEGTGLGLAMVHGIMEDHQGAIVIGSEVGRGTTVDLYFPAGSDAPRAGPVPGSSHPFGKNPPFGRGRRIMVVDDDDAVLGIVQHLLTRGGFVAEPFSDPAAALEKFLATPYECAAAISDLTMPGMTGVELAQRFHEVRPGFPFILASGYLHDKAVQGAQVSGVTDFVKKPFDLDDLMGKLRAALDPADAN